MLAALHVAVGHRSVIMLQENDGYAFQAEQILSAHWPRDVYRPAGYILLAAAGGALLGDCFLSCMVISATASGCLVWIAYCIGSRIGGNRAGLLACAFCAANSLVLPNGFLAATDMLFAANFNLTLLAALRFADHPGPHRAFLMGVALSLAFFTRYQAVALAPATGFVVWAFSSRRTFWAHAAAIGSGALLGLLPHMTASWLQFGKLFHDENWRSLALRHFGPPGDWSYLNNNPFDGLLSVLRHDPHRMLMTATSELLSFPRNGLGEALGLSKQWTHDWLTLPVFATGALLGLSRIPRATCAILIAFLSYVALLCTTFFASGRFCLPLVPTAAVLLALTLECLRTERLPAPRIRLAAWAGIATVLLALSLQQSLDRAAQYVREEPGSMVGFAKNLAASSSHKLKVVGNYWALPHYVDVDHAFVAIGGDLQGAWSSIRRTAKSFDADYVLLHKEEAWMVWHQFVNLPTPPDFEAVIVRDEFRAYRAFAQRADLSKLANIQHVSTGDGWIQAQAVSQVADPDCSLFLLVYPPALEDAFTVPFPEFGGLVTKASFRATSPGEWIVQATGKSTDATRHAGISYSFLVGSNGLPPAFDTRNMVGTNGIDTLLPMRKDTNGSAKTQPLDTLIRLEVAWNRSGDALSCLVRNIPFTGKVLVMASREPADAQLNDDVVAKIAWPPAFHAELAQHTQDPSTASGELRLNPIPLGAPLFLQAALLLDDRVILASNGVKVEVR